MKYTNKTKEQLIDKLKETNQRVADLQALEIKRNQMEKALRDSEQRFKMLFDSAPDGIYITDLKGNFIDGNKMAERIIGYPRDELIGKNFLKINVLSRAQVDKAAGLLAKNALGQSTGPDEFTLHRKDGSQLLVEIRTHPIINKDRTLVFGIARDIIGRKHMEEVYRLVVDTSLQGLVLTQDFRFVLVNKALAEMSGYTTEELMDFTPEDMKAMIYPEDQEYALGIAQKCQKGEKVPSRYEFRFVRKDGSVGWTEQYARLIEYNGRPAMLVDYIDITERKKMEVEIRKSETLLRTQFENSPDMIMILDRNLRYVKINKVLYGNYTPEALIGQDAILPLPSSVQEIVRNKIEQCFKTGMIQEFDHTVGDTNWVHARVVPLLSGNTVDQVMIISTDITERKKMEDSLRESERKYRELADYLPQLVCETDIEGKIVYANENAFKMLGYSSDDMKDGVTIFQLMQSEDLDRVRRNMSKVLNGENIGGNEYSMCRRDGISFPLLVHSSPIVHENKPIGLRIIGVDISERKKAEEQLARSERRFRSVFENNTEGILLLDSEGTFIDCNVKMEEIFGQPRGEILEMKPWGFSPLLQPDGRDSKEKAQELVNAAFQGKPQLFEWVHSRSDGSLIDTEIALSTIEAEEGELILAIVRDITKQKEAEKERFHSTQKLLGAMEATIEAMALTVDMRDPYTAGHQRRVTKLAIAIAREMCLSEEEIQGINMASIVHDIGKIQIPAEILSKPGRLNDFEFALIKNHPSVGYEILKNIDFPWPVAQIVLQHHERMDGSGYPNGVLGEDILLEARILSVADVVEAMASHRPYRPALGIDAAIDEISKNSDTLYDSKIVETCIKLFRNKGFSFD